MYTCMVRHPRGSCISIPVGLSFVSGLAQISKQGNRRCHPRARKYAQGVEVRPQKRFYIVGCRSPLIVTRRAPHVPSHLVQAMPPWLVKTRRVPSWYRRDPIVYGLKTVALHHVSTPSPVNPPPSHPPASPCLVAARPSSTLLSSQKMVN